MTPADDANATVIPARRSLIGRVEPVLRWRYPILVTLALAFCLQHLRGTGEDWRYFVEGSELLFGQHHGYTSLAGGLNLYANYPDYQIGPLSFLVATPLRFLGGSDGRVVASLLMTGAAPALVFVLESSARRLWGAAERSETLLRATVLLGGLIVVQAWSPLATIYNHLDDVLVLGFGVLAVWAVAHRRPLLVGLMIGLAVAAKPWGVVALPLVLALPRGGRLKATATSLSLIAVAWLPFILANPDTLDAIRPAVVTAPSSVLHLFGVPVTDAPPWVRPLQLFGALLAGGVAIWKGRWAAVLLVGIAVRVALDPQVFLYYSAGLVSAALVWDLLRSPNPLPIWTFVTFVLLNDAYVVVGSDRGKAVMRLLITLAIVGSAVLWPSGKSRSTTKTGLVPEDLSGPA